MNDGRERIPTSLKGEKIPLLSRILAVVDAYDAMTQGRPYKKAISPHQAAIELIRYAGRQFDPNIVKVFIEQVLQEEISDDELAAFGPDTFSLNLASDGEHFGR
jgi:HD-GYP domain-containing protein (c-di-GMP phosphodiesterase class II)